MSGSSNRLLDETAGDSATCTLPDGTTRRLSGHATEVDEHAPGAEHRPGGDDTAAGVQVGSYVIGSVIGRGGFSTVYTARHAITGERVAIKILRRKWAQSRQNVRRFVREARAVGSIRHPNVVEIHRVGDLDDGRPYLVMELLNGITLAERLKIDGRFAPGEALAFFEQVCHGLKAVHEAGIVHRDVKTSNVMIAHCDEGPVIKLVDFGIAKLLDSHCMPATVVTTAGRLMGTPYAMAPEQIRRASVDTRTDIYALGVLLFELLTGQRPYRGKDIIAVMQAHLNDPPPHASELAPVNPAIDAVIVRCLQKSPEQRYESVFDLIRAVREALAATGAESVLSARAMAVYVEASVAALSDDDGDAVLDRLMDLLMLAEERLYEAGFAITLRTGSGILGTRLLPPDGGATGDQSADAYRVARAIHDELSASLDGDGIGFAIRVNEDSAIVDGAAGSATVVSGAITHIESWAPNTLLGDAARATD